MKEADFSASHFYLHKTYTFIYDIIYTSYFKDRHITGGKSE